MNYEFKKISLDDYELIYKKDDEEKKPHKKNRLRDKKNKGKPDFAAKRAKKAARLAAKENQ